MESSCPFYFVSIPFRRHETLATMFDKGNEYTNMYMHAIGILHSLLQAEYSRRLATHL